jgi:tetratricopeptide (TPR) repeat protein
LQQLAGMPAISNEAHAGWRQAVSWLGESPEAVPWLQAYVSAYPQDNELRLRLEMLEPQLARQSALRQAFQALEAGELNQAEEKFQSIPGAECDLEALVGLASVALARKTFDQAVKLLCQTRELAPQRPEVWQPLLQTAELWQAIKRAEALRREGRLDEAQSLLEQAATSVADERYQAVLALVEVLLERGARTRAQHSLHELLTAPPADTAGLRRLVVLLLRANLEEQAVVANESLRGIDASAAFSPKGLQAEKLRQLAMQLRKAGDVIAARDSLVAATSLDERASQVWLDLAHLDLELGDLDEAQRSVETLLRARPGRPEAVLVAARLAEQRGEHERGLELLGTVAAQDSSDEIDNLRRRLEVRLSAARAVSAFRIGGVSAARMQLSELERAAPSSTHLAILAEAWADIGEVDHAVLLLHAGEMASAKEPGVRLQLATLLLRAGRTSEAMAVLEELAAQPGLAPAELSSLQKLRIGCAVRVADSRRSQGDLAGARSELATWTGARPPEPQIANAYGRVLHDAGDCVAAAEQFVLVLKRDPGNLDALQG